MMAEASLAAVKVEELLKEVRVDYTTTKSVEAAIAGLQEFLLGLSETEVSPSLAGTFVNELGVSEEKCRFRFQKPDAVEVIGSFLTQSVTKPVQNVDLALRIPKACFHEKDFLNYRYHAKRIIYLCAIERELSKSARYKKTEWASCTEDASKPILVVYPDVATKFILRLIPAISTEHFDITKFGLERNNVREAKSKDPVSTCLPRTEGVALPTPHYSSSIVEDMLLLEHSAWLQSHLSRSPAMRDAVCLAKVWLRQRSVDGYHNGLNGFLMSMLIVHLSTSSGKFRISEHMSALQMFRVTLDSIGTMDVLGRGVTMEKSGGKYGSPDIKQMKSAFEVVMVDPSGRLNLTYRLTKSALAELKDDALRTLETMKNPRDAGFDTVFMTRVGFAAKYDCHVRIAKPSAVSASPHCLDQGSWRLYEKKLETVLSRAFGERALLVRVLQRMLPAGWRPSEGLACVGNVPLLAGIQFNNLDIAFRLADIGPGADDKEEARKFRAFWGQKAELRRFKDGKISETAVWECEPTQRHLIVEQIVHHVLQRHLAIPPSDITVVAGQLDFAITVRGKDQVAVMPTILEAFETLSKRLRSMEDLPLRVVSVQPLSAEFRYAAVCYPQPHPLAAEVKESNPLTKAVGACLDPLEVVIQLEGSGRWPDAPVAIQRTKLAFCLNIANRMQEKWGVHCIASEDAVDILMEGFAFRLSILYEKDRTFINKEKLASALSSGGALPVKVGAASLIAQPMSLKEDRLLRSMHASILHGLHGLYPAFSPTVRLAKRWVASHLFSGVIVEEAVELLVAYLFVNPAPFPRPSSRVTGLLRFLHLLERHDWLLSPLVVDVNASMTSQDEEFIMSQFSKLNRDSSNDCEGPAMYIATAYDLCSETWTRDCPNSKGLKRLVAYARSSSALLTSMIMSEESTVKWQTLFRTPLGCYDAVVRLQEQSLAHPSRLLFPVELDIPAVVTKKKPNDILAMISPTVMKAGALAARNYVLIGFDPVDYYVKDLRERLGETCLVFYDHLGSDVLGVTWTTTPSSKKRREEKVVGTIDVTAVVRHLSEAGTGLVKSIHLSDKVRGAFVANLQTSVASESREAAGYERASKKVKRSEVSKKKKAKALKKMRALVLEM